jgi:hypothetical protein
MSFLAAHLIHSVHAAAAAEKSRMICLYWFAGEHRNSRKDANANVQAIVRSLIGQLGNLYKGFDLYFIKRSTVQSIREDDDLKVLCDVFNELIFQLPAKTTIFCVIDWLAYLEYEHKEEVLSLVQRLCMVARHADGYGSMFKLLFTHAGGAFGAASEFNADNEVVSVPEDAGGERMGFNKLIWETKVGNKIVEIPRKQKV